MSQPLVSILTPFKNVSDYIEECLKSIINQSYANWELLIVDDQSTDNSYTIVEKFSKSDNRIKLYKNEGSGIINALQKAFSESSGDFITRMDSDDIMTQNKLEVMVNQLNKFGKQHVALGLVKYFSKTGISDGYAKYEAWLNRLTKEGANYSEIYKECVIASPCWMLHRDDLLACNAFNPNRYPEDYDLTFRFYEHGFRCIPSNELLHYWRDYSTRTSRTHEHYAQNYFLDIKLHYFLKLDNDTSRPITIWGAGYKGKNIAKALVERNIKFHWICDNKKKIGKDIYGVKLQPFEDLKAIKNPQTIVTVANDTEQKNIVSYFDNLNMKPMTDYFFFC
ncbi:glycosyl transferase family 2 [Winogradskyella sp. PC-19]|uniref:glycosyltransferase family 2 protein n=1 Tax=unclassified Winogradskyella TaxID=2615021 RepID=UPI000B3CF538|nr:MULTISPECIES: glycosyltransferase family 2 protein [unclassified Winogradskyella]ARV08593.1 glycosyl transferase family 2 [Winogradskyella sp. PC-19]RZN77435.1 MAG: glycosyltransferase family 2 protein [Winogradskyella sp.]